MKMLDMLSWIVLGGLVGWLASVVMGTRREQGCITDVLVGIAGAFVGGAVLSFIQGQGLQFRGDLDFNMGSLLTALLGAILLLGVLRILR